jgi:hypothetical protein
MSSDSATLVPTQQSVKAYVDSQVTAQDLDFQADSGGALSIDLDTETMTFTGGTGIDTTGSGNDVEFAIDSTVATLTGTQTLTNKTLTSPDVNTPDIDGGTIDGAVIGGTTPAAVSATTVSATGNITVGGTVDGRDVATDGTKLDGIESGATADQTAAEIRTLVDSATDSNVFTDADHTKLDGIEAGADVTDTTNVTAAGAVMDSELTNETAVKSLDQGVATTDSPTFAGLTTTADVSFGDNDKAIFGAGSDLQIYHTGSQNYIEDAGTGNLNFKSNGNNFNFLDGSDNVVMQIDIDSETTLYHNTSAKLATTSTGIDVTGNVVSDGLTVDGDGSFTGTFEISGLSPKIFLNETDTTDVNTRIRNAGGNLQIQTVDNSDSNPVTRFEIDHATGDISFYEDTGTTAKLFWDAANERLGIGNSSPSTALDVTGTVTADGLTVDGSATIQSTSSPAISVIDTTNNVEARLQAFNSTATVGTQSNHSFSIETNDTNRALFATNGDISFYEDTGTTAKLFWDASEESLGIGTSSPSSYGHSLVVAKDASGGATYATITNTNANQFLNLGINADVAEITWDNADSLAFGTTAASTDEGQTFEAMRISSSGNVGIGTDSPSAPLSFGANIPSDGQTIHTYHSGNTRSGLGVVAGVHRVFTNSSSALSFGQVSDSDGSTYTERMRIDSSGNLLVGTTNTLPQTLTSGGGFCYAPDSSLRIARQSDGTGQPTLDLNNSGSDDEIIRFRKDGATVGSIGVLSNRLYIGSGDTGIKFSGADDLISPIDASDGTGRNGFIDLGSSGARFKDLYLSGGAYLGGTAAANKLDDYEEGTWTPAPTSGTLNAGATGSYVKIGNLVHVQGQLSFSANGTTNRIDGLPFRPRIEAALSSIRQRFLIYATTSSTAIYGSCQDNNDALFLQDENRTAHDFDTADGVYTFAFTYET